MEEDSGGTENSNSHPMDTHNEHQNLLNSSKLIIENKRTAYVNINNPLLKDKTFFDICAEFEKSNTDILPDNIDLNRNLLQLFYKNELIRNNVLSKKVNLFNLKFTIEKPRELESIKIIRIGDIYGKTIPNVIEHKEVEQWLLTKFHGLKLATDNVTQFAPIQNCSIIRSNVRIIKVVVPHEYALPGYVWCQTSSMLKPIKIKLWHYGMNVYCKRCMQIGHLKKDCAIKFDNLPKPMYNVNTYASKLRPNFRKQPMDNNIDILRDSTPSDNSILIPPTEIMSSDRNNTHTPETMSSGVDNNMDEQIVVDNLKSSGLSDIDYPPLTSPEKIKLDFEPFFTKNCFLSNHYPCKFTSDGLNFRSTEHYLFYKTAEKLNANESLLQNILNAGTAAAAKRLGEQLRGAPTSDWYQFAEKMLYDGNLLKYSQNKDLRYKFFQTFPKDLIEANPHDRYWGVGYSRDNPLIVDRTKWGQNVFRKLLMKLRETMMKDPAYEFDTAFRLRMVNLAKRFRPDDGSGQETGRKMSKQIFDMYCQGDPKRFRAGDAQCSTSNMSDFDSLCKMHVIDLVAKSITKSGGERKILASSINNDQTYTLILKGVWFDCCMKIGDPFRIFVNSEDLDEDWSPIVFDNNSKNLILVCPDKLMSANEVASAAFCRRKSVLNEKFRCTDDVGGNKAMLLGTLLHRLFQKAIVEQWNGVKHLESEFSTFFSEVGVLESMYFCSVNKSAMQLDASAYFEKLNELLINKFKPGKSILFKNSTNERDVQFEKVEDIEENIWCPRYGLRGKIDVTLGIREKDESRGIQSSSILPLELKTGKTSQSVEHRAQVLLYNLLLSQNHFDVNENGLLLYLKDGHLSHMKVNYRDIRGLFHLRNEMARCIALFGSIDTKNNIMDFELPESLSSTRFCPTCPQALNCSLMSKLESKARGIDADENRQQFIDEVTGHLTEPYLEYFEKWLRWMCLENAEQASRRSQMSDLWLKTAAERATSSNALNNLYFEKMITSPDNDQSLQMKLYGRNITFGIFEVGDYCIVSNVTKNRIAAASGFVSEICDREILLNVPKSYNFDPNDELVLDHYNSSASSFRSQLGILSKMMALSEHSRKIRELVIDLKTPTFQAKLVKDTILKSKSHLSLLNKQQVLAVVKALRANDYALIRGLPGTGKTFCIVTLIEILCSLGHTILLTSYTNSAVDSILGKLNKEFTHGKILRLGPSIDKSNAKFTIAEHLKRGMTIKEIYEEIPIVAATASTVSSHPLFATKRFDVAIVDEATQVQELLSVGPLLCCSKFILVGDSKQLNPLVTSKQCKSEGMGESLFSRLELAHPISVTTLNEQFRMNKEILQISNQLFYDGQLKCSGEIVAENFLEVQASSLSFDLLNEHWLRPCLSSDPESSVIFLNHEGRAALSGGQIRNEIECDIVGRLIEAYLEAKISPSNIGIICVYRNQVKIVKDKLLPLCEDLEINTVDQFQGRDKDIIIVSFVWTSKIDDIGYKKFPQNSCADHKYALCAELCSFEKLHLSAIVNPREKVPYLRRTYFPDQDGKASRSDLLHDFRRINVLLTRAKQKLIMLGSRNDLCASHEWVSKICDLLQPSQIINV